MTTMDRMWAASAALIALGAAVNIANWIFHAHIVVLVLFGVQLLVLAVWIRLTVRQWKGNAP